MEAGSNKEGALGELYQHREANSMQRAGDSACPGDPELLAAKGTSVSVDKEHIIVGF